MDFIEKEIPFQRERRFDVFYKGKKLRHPYFADFILYDSIVLEIKSASSIIDTHIAQALSYLSVAEKKLAIVINFGEKSLTYKRIVL